MTYKINSTIRSSKSHRLFAIAIGMFLFIALLTVNVQQAVSQEVGVASNEAIQTEANAAGQDSGAQAAQEAPSTERFGKPITPRGDAYVSGDRWNVCRHEAGEVVTWQNSSCTSIIGLAAPTLTLRHDAEAEILEVVVTVDGIHCRILGILCFTADSVRASMARWDCHQFNLEGQNRISDINLHSILATEDTITSVYRKENVSSLNTSASAYVLGLSRDNITRTPSVSGNIISSYTACNIDFTGLMDHNVIDEDKIDERIPVGTTWKLCRLHSADDSTFIGRYIRRVNRTWVQVPSSVNCSSSFTWTPQPPEGTIQIKYEAVYEYNEVTEVHDILRNSVANISVVSYSDELLTEEKAIALAKRFECTVFRVDGFVSPFPLTLFEATHNYVARSEQYVTKFATAAARDFTDESFRGFTFPAAQVEAGELDTLYVELVAHNMPSMIHEFGQLSTHAVLDEAISSCGQAQIALVGMEVTQGTQDLIGSLRLIRDRHTMLRAFFTTDNVTPIGITAKLKGKVKRQSGTEDLGVIEAENTRQTVFLTDGECDPQEGMLLRACRRDIDKSLNFVIPLSWTDSVKLATESLILELEFGDEFDVECKERISPVSTCSAEVSITTVLPPRNVVLYAVPLRNTLVEAPGSISMQVTTEDLALQWRRIHSMLPLPEDMGLETEVEPRLGYGRYRILTFDAISDDDETIPKTFDTISRVNQKMQEIVNNHPYAAISHRATVMLGVVPGEPVEAPPPVSQTYAHGALWSGRSSGFLVSSWYDFGINNQGGDRASYFGGHRNLGAREFMHAIRVSDLIADSSRLTGFCGVAPDYAGPLGPYGTPRHHAWVDDPYPKQDDFPLIDDDARPGNEFIPLLGPLGNHNREIWGLDLDMFAWFRESRKISLGQPGQTDLFLPLFTKSLIVSDPYVTLPVMGGCIPPDSWEWNSTWMDAGSYEKAIDALRQGFLPAPSGSNDADGSVADPSSDAGGSAEESATGAATASADLISGIFKYDPVADSVTDATLNPVYSVPWEVEEYTSGDYTLELLDSSNTSLRSLPFPAVRSNNSPAYGTPPRIDVPFRVPVVNPPNYASLAIKKGTVTIKTWQRSANAPVASITGATANQTYGEADTITITLTATDQDGDSMRYTPYYSTNGGKDFLPLSFFDFDASKTSIPVLASKLLGSDEAMIAVAVTDGLRSTFVKGPVFKVTNKAPTVEIISPANGSMFAEQGFVFQATGYDHEDGFLGFNDFTWSSNIDGNLGTGRILSLSTEDLTNGAHTITLTGTDSSGVTATATASITANKANSVPVAVDDSTAVDLFGTINIDVLANDTDTERDIRSLTITSEPALGVSTVTTTSTGSMQVEYLGHTSGRDSFEYEICDGIDRCDTATVAVNVGLADCTIIGTESDDTLMGTEGDDVICGLGGNDFIEGRAGNDIILGGTGNDRIYGRLGNDTIRGEVGDDFILGHRGNDTIYGGAGDDTIYGAEGDDTIYGEHGADKLYGQIGSDTVEGGKGDDLIHGGKGDDTVKGDSGDDTIRGNAGVDIIYGGTGVDTFLGVSVIDDTIMDVTDADSMDMEDGSTPTTSSTTTTTLPEPIRLPSSPATPTTSSTTTTTLPSQ